MIYLFKTNVLRNSNTEIKGKLSLNPPSVPKISVSWYKDGGIMTNPTLFGFAGNKAMVGGEAGPEAILPLNNFYKYLDNRSLCLLLP